MTTIAVNFRTAVCLVLSACAFFAGSVSHAQTIVRVPTDQATFSAALAAVPDGGIIEMAGGTYQAPHGAFTIYTDPTIPPAAPKAFTVRAAPGATVILSGGGATDILRFTNRSLAEGKPLTFERIIFANGLTTDRFLGGGLTLVNAEAVFIGCTFQNNAANSANGTGGGGLWIASSAVAFQDCRWTGNTSPNFGGGLTSLDSRIFFRNSTFSDNRVNLPGHVNNSAGGAVYAVNSTVQVNNCSFRNNQAGYVGGAIYLVGDWRNPESTPASLLSVSDSEFTGNLATRDASVSFSEPAVGGAIHAENQSTLKLAHCRFTDNVARQGGGISLFKAIGEIEGCVFKGNRGTGTGDQEGFGGTIMALSTDFAPPNRRAISLSIIDSSFEGNGAVSSARQGGCIFASGDLNLTLPSSRGVLTLTRVSISNFSSVGGGGLPGTGGAILGDFLDLTISSSIISNCNSTHSGAAIQLTQATAASITNLTVNQCRSGDLGAGITMFGGTLNVSGSNFLENQNGGGRGAAITTAPATAGGGLPDMEVNGLIQDCVFSGNVGESTIYDGDRATPPFNRLQFGNNAFFPGGGSNVYYTDAAGSRTVAGLNSLTIPRSDGTTTVKAPFPNVALSSAPVVGALLMVPPIVLQTGAPGEILPIPSNLAYAASGGAVALDGTPQASNWGVVPTSANGVHTLTVGSTSVSTVPPPGVALNISTRLPVGTDQNVLIGGFIIQGPNPKNVIIRAIGPSLPLAGTLQDPVLELHDGTGALIARNNNWRSTQIGGLITSGQSIDIQASGLAPLHDAESAIIATLSPGAYTAVVRGANNTTGIAVVEGYDLDADKSSKLANISTRGFVQTGDNVMIGGFIMGGGAGATRVVVRGIGPSLGALGIANPLADPMLELYDANGALIDSNDDWRTNQAVILSTGLAPTHDAESALLLANPAPGGYTAILRGKNGGTGIGVAEVYVFQ